jgi:hypothetical protein
MTRSWVRNGPGWEEMKRRAFPWEFPFCEDYLPVSGGPGRKPEICGDEACVQAYNRCWKRDAARGIRRRNVVPEKCVAIVLPLKERKARACGHPAYMIVDGRKLCARHARRLLEKKGGGNAR